MRERAGAARVISGAARAATALRRGAVLLALPLTLSCARSAPEPWQEVRLGTDARFGGLWFTDSLNGWIAGGAREVPGGLLGRTRDGGRSWTIRSNVLPDMEPGVHLAGIQFRDSSNGCVVAEGGMVLLTADGGLNWRRVRSGRSSSDGLMRVQLLDDHYGWAVGSASLVGTRDGGETWGGLVYNSDENGYLSGTAVAFTDPSRGWLVTHSGQLMRSDDGGVHWTQVPLPLDPGSHPILWDITFTDPEHGWLVGEEGTICRTSDGGATWEMQTSGVPLLRALPRGEKPRRPDIIPGLDGGPSHLTLTAVRFADVRRGFALGFYSDAGESVILGTRDGGATWRTERVAPGQYLHALFVLDRTHAWAAGDRERMLPQVMYRYTAPDSG